MDHSTARKFLQDNDLLNSGIIAEKTNSLMGNIIQGVEKDGRVDLTDPQTLIALAPGPWLGREPGRLPPQTWSPSCRHSLPNLGP